MVLANYLTGPDLKGRRVVAYIPNEARADAAFVALACDDIVMHPDAVLGGAGAYQVPDDQVANTVEALREVAKAKYRSWSLPAAMVDRKLEVHRYTHQVDGLTEYFSEQELKEQPDPESWVRGEKITDAAQAFSVRGDQAEDLGLASDAVDSFDEFKALYGLEKDPLLVEPGWADFLIDALASPGMAWLLLLAGGAALYAEFQSPGIGIGGFVATVCFAMFFWANYLGGTAGWLEVLLFLIGAIFILLEVFVLPGFGIFGLGGGLLVIVSLVLASQTFRQFPQNDYQFGEMLSSLLVVAGAGAGVIVAIFLLNHFLGRSAGFSQMVLVPPSDAELANISRKEAVASYEYLVGLTGTAVTPLIPSGKARIDNHLVDVISADGDMLAVGTPLTVVQARGNRILVRAVE
jgi:membrane-bound ClpP family serine protease